MGVPVGDADGDHPVLLVCRSCGDPFETDETMNNACASCGSGRIDIVETDPDLVDDWRADPSRFIDDQEDDA